MRGDCFGLEMFEKIFEKIRMKEKKEKIWKNAMLIEKRNEENLPSFSISVGKLMRMNEKSNRSFVFVRKREEFCWKIFLHHQNFSFLLTLFFTQTSTSL